MVKIERRQNHPVLQQPAREQGYKITYERLARMLGTSSSTTAYRFGVSNQSVALGMVCLLERLSDGGLQRFIRSVCRTLPTVFHSSLAHSPRTVADLLETLKNPCGLTLLRGGSEASRSFLVAALGHTYAQMCPRHPTAVGLDVCSPNKFVPVETLHYPSGTTDAELRRIAVAVWPRVREATSPLVLLNGIWSLAPELHEEIVESARTRNVVLADSLLPDLEKLGKKGLRPLQKFTIDQVEPHRIELSRQVWQPRGRPRKKSP